MQAKILRRRKGEEEANNLLLSYFENPVIAPVRQPVEKNEAPVVVEKTPDLEPESKSIWSNFSEVLKRPPREKPKEPEKKIEETKEEEEEDEGPPKLTMFDLIKSKRN